MHDARQQHLRVCRAIGVLRFDGPLPLGSRRGIQSEFIRWAKRRPSVRSVILVASTLDRLERAEADNLVALIDAMREADYRVVLASVTDEAFETLGRTGLADAIGLQFILASEYLGIDELYAAAHQGIDEGALPLPQPDPAGGGTGAPSRWLAAGRLPAQSGALPADCGGPLRRSRSTSRPSGCSRSSLPAVSSVVRRRSTC